MVDGYSHRLALSLGWLVCLWSVASGLGADSRRLVYRPRPDPVVPQVEAAAELINRGQRAAGIQQLQAILQQYPTHRQALEVLAEVYLQNRRGEEAAELLGRCVKKHSDSWRCRTMVGQLLLEQGRVGRAVEMLTKAVSANSAHPQAHFYLGQALFQQGKLEQAEVALNHALAYRKPGTLAAVHLHLAKLYSRQHRPDQEAQALEWYLRENPNLQNAEQLRERITQLRATTDGQH